MSQKKKSALLGVVGRRGGKRKLGRTETLPQGFKAGVIRPQVCVRGHKERADPGGRVLLGGPILA